MPPEALESIAGLSEDFLPALPDGIATADLVAHLLERLADLEIAQDDRGWLPLGSLGEDDFTREGLRRIHERSRLMGLKDPLIGRGIEVQVDYVWGQGVNIKAADDRVQDVVDAFWADPKNRGELTSDEALAAKEVTLMVSGNMFLALFVNPANGKVRVRSLPFDQIQEIYFNPEDGREPWYYRRTWTEKRLDPERQQPLINERSAWYPDWRFAPDNTPGRIALSEVVETPVMHVKVGGYEDMRFGLPLTFNALDWAKAYKDFLTDWATLTKALSKFAWKATVKGGQDKVTALTASLSRTPPTAEEPNTNRRTTAGIWTQNEQVDLAPMPKSGATVSSEDGRRLLLQVAAAFGVPETFFGDADVGNHATAKTLDRPTELKFRRRQTHWANVLEDLLGYVVDQAIAAPSGALDGQFEDPADDDPMDVGRWLLAPPDEVQPGAEMPKEGDKTIDVTFPPILEHDTAGSVNAIVDAITLKGSTLNDTLITPEQASRLILEALGVDDIEDWLREIFPVDAAGKPELRADQQRREELQAKADATKLAIAGRTPDGGPAGPEGQGPPAGGGAPPGERPAREAFQEGIAALITYVETKLAD